MPNWTDNTMLIKKKYWDKFKEVAFNKDGEVTLEKLIPHSESVIADLYYDHFITNEPHGINMDEDLDKYKTISEDFFQDHNGEKVILYHKMLEAVDGDKDKLLGWYKWQIENWGTKWDAGDTSIDNGYELDELTENECVIVRFNTAWSGPVPWFEKLSFILPFEVECTDECGMYHWNCKSDGQGNFTLEDDTDEYFASLNEDEDDEDEDEEDE